MKTEGFYRRDGDRLLHANRVYHRNYTLTPDARRPTAGKWQWFDSEAEAREAFGLTEMEFVDAYRAEGVEDDETIARLQRAVERVRVRMRRRGGISRGNIRGVAWNL
jgi:hypothetical protein